MSENNEKIKNIKFLYNKLNHKGNFISMVAKDLGKSKKTLRQHWFSNTMDWSIPEVYQDRVIELLQRTIWFQEQHSTID